MSGCSDCGKQGARLYTKMQRCHRCFEWEVRYRRREQFLRASEGSTRCTYVMRLRDDSPACPYIAEDGRGCVDVPKGHLVHRLEQIL